ncbi:MAG TPA: T9SS type A sorting domain-containing protein [Ignavibacteriaceae bacterium]|nr:T9SS type A sorting domain-containing protein [Ignavibacteriaceae bacterium]
MKRAFSFFVLFLLTSVFMLDGVAQSFYTGAIGITQSNGGRTRVFADNLTTRQLDRVSILVGVNSSQVFDYNQDQNGLVPAATLASPALSDFEVTSTIDNTYSNLPPNVEVAMNIYGWTNGAYLLVKMNVKNNEASAINAVIGLEAIPQIDGSYGNETVQWNAASNTVLMNKTTWAGIKFFSAMQTALKSIEWTSGYGNDSLYYNWLTQGSFDPPLTVGVDGAVAILGQAPIPLNPGQSTDFYFGISIGADQAACLANMNLCEDKFNIIVPVELTSFTANIIGNKVSLSWSTATEINNWGFEIERRAADTPEWIRVGYKEGFGTTTEAQNYSFIDDISGIQSKVVYYRLKQIDFNGSYTYYGEIEVENRFAPDNFVLEQNYPNPFNPVTRISFGIPQKSNVMLRVFNLIGEEVAVLASGLYEAGTYNFDFDASGLPSGVYVYALQTENSIISKKMTLLK